jgi:hypothetical protein
MTDKAPLNARMVTYVVVPLLMATYVAWPFLHPFHTHHTTLVHWVWGVPVLVCCAFLLVRSVIRVVLRRRAA